MPQWRPLDQGRGQSRDIKTTLSMGLGPKRFQFEQRVYLVLDLQFIEKQ
jgi:hypothetical protein